MLKIGSHVSFKAKDYLVGAAKEALSYGANTMMIYLGAPQNTKRVNVDKYCYEKYKKNYSSLIKPEDIIIHAPYIVNPASLKNWEFARDFIIQEIKRMNFIGAKYLVLHPGSSTKYPREKSILQLIETIKQILSKTEKVDILLETMAGKGNEIGINFQEINYILKKINSEKVGICLDTCHVWESGIDIKNFDLFINELKKYELLKKIKVFHINDSKNLLGEKKDRHENIGEGKIGLEALQKIVNHNEFENIPMILETPWVNNKAIYKKEIAMLKTK